MVNGEEWWGTMVDVSGGEKQKEKRKKNKRKKNEKIRHYI